MRPMSLTSAYLYLGAAIVSEVIATSSLKASANFTKAGPSAVTIAGYALAFWCLSFTLRTLPLGIAYAIWSGVGIVLIAAVGRVWLKQELDVPAMTGMGLIIAGVVVVNVFSKSISR